MRPTLTPEARRHGWAMSWHWIAWAQHPTATPEQRDARRRHREKAQQAMVALYIHVGRMQAARYFERTQGRKLSLGELQSAADFGMVLAARSYNPLLQGKDGKPVGLRAFAPYARRYAVEMIRDALGEASEQPHQLLPMAEDMEREWEEHSDLDLRRWLRSWAWTQLTLPGVALAPPRTPERSRRSILRPLRHKSPWRQLGLWEERSGNP